MYATGEMVVQCRCISWGDKDSVTVQWKALHILHAFSVHQCDVKFFSAKYSVSNSLLHFKQQTYYQIIKNHYYVIIKLRRNWGW